MKTQTQIRLLDCLIVIMAATPISFAIYGFVQIYLPLLKGTR